MISHCQRWSVQMALITQRYSECQEKSNGVAIGCLVRVGVGVGEEI